MNVIITGATRGIGRAIAETFAREGHDLVICARSENDLERLKKQFSKIFPGISVYTKTADTAESLQMKEFGEWIIASGLTPDVLINNAGYFTPATIYSEEDGLLQKMIDINLNGPYHLTRSLLPAMMERRKGHIFNICSIASITPMPNVGSYGISKFALYGFTKHLREEMKPFGIKVTAVCPGATYTSSWQGSGIDPDRLLKADDVAKMVFVSSQLSFSAAVEDIIIRPQQGDI